MLEAKDIMRILPHRNPFLLVDRVIELEEGKRAVGIKNVTMNENFFVGHFPGHPIMPGVLMVEAMAQLGAIIILKLPESEGKIIYFAGIDRVRFRQPVIPGDQLRIEVELIKVKGSLGKAAGKITVAGKEVCSAEIMFSLVDGNQGGVKIHATATVHPSAVLAKGVEIGPYALIGPEVVIGEGTRVGAHTVIRKWTKIGRDNIIEAGCVIGNDPQDRRYKGEKTAIEIGDRNIIREQVSINLSTGQGNKTVIGDDNFIMTASHVAHNCKIGNHVTMTNLVGLCGHVVIEDEATVGGAAGFHQFVRIGKMSMVGGMARVPQDVPPFMLVAGDPAEVKGVNLVGLARRGVSRESIEELKKFYKIFWRSKLSIPGAIEKIEKELKQTEEVKYLINFIKHSERGVLKKLPVEKSENIEGD